MFREDSGGFSGLHKVSGTFQVGLRELPGSQGCFRKFQSVSEGYHEVSGISGGSVGNHEPSGVFQGVAGDFMGFQMISGALLGALWVTLMGFQSL